MMQHHQHHMMVGTISQLYFHIRQLPFLTNNRVNCVKPITLHIRYTFPVAIYIVMPSMY